MKKTLKILLCLVVVSATSFAQTKKSGVSNKGFLVSRSYKDYLATYKNKSEIQSADKRFFTLIGEESFLYDSNYGSYMIYISGAKDNSATIFIVKSKEGISNSTIKHIAQTDHLFFAKPGNPNNETNFKFITSSKIITGNKVSEFNNFLSGYTHRLSNRIPAARDETFKLLFYFDGKNYYRISNYQIDSSAMQKIDNLFRTSTAFH